MLRFFPRIAHWGHLNHRCGPGWDDSEETSDSSEDDPDHDEEGDRCRLSVVLAESAGARMGETLTRCHCDESWGVDVKGFSTTDFNFLERCPSWSWLGVGLTARSIDCKAQVAASVRSASSSAF